MKNMTLVLTFLLASVLVCGCSGKTQKPEYYYIPTEISLPPETKTKYRRPKLEGDTNGDLVSLVVKQDKVITGYEKKIDALVQFEADYNSEVKKIQEDVRSK